MTRQPDQPLARASARRAGWLVALLALLTGPALADDVPAGEIGEAPFRAVSALAAEGFTPFAVSQAGNASFGMMRDEQMYLCFIADRTDTQVRRQTVLMAIVNGQDPDPTVPNIPLLCIQTQ